MANTKKYLDLVGLTHYDEKIKAYIKTNGSDVTDKLVALIGAAEKGEDAKTILARIADLETAVGDVSELGDEVANLVKAILGEATRAQAAEDDLQDAIDALDEKLYGSDVESEGATTHTKGDIDKIQDRLTAIETDTKDAAAIAALEERLYGTGEGDAHVKGTLDEMADATAAAQKDVDDLADLVGVLPEGAEEGATVVSHLAALIDAEEERAEGVESDLQSAIEAEETARKAQIGDLGKVSEEADAADHTVKSYVDAAIEAVNGDADALEDRVEALEATHATKEDGSFKTVGEEVNEAVVALVDGAPAALDTLKEIADWIANQDESGVTDVASLVSRVEINSGNIEDEVQRATGAEAALGLRIDSILDSDDDKSLESRVSKMEADLADTDVFAAISNDEIDALFETKA